MKIYEIIATEGTWDEFVGGLAKGAGKLIGRGSTWRTAQELAPDVAREMSRLGRGRLSDAEVKEIMIRGFSNPEIEDALAKYARAKGISVADLTAAERASITSKYVEEPSADLVKQTKKAAKDLFDKQEKEKSIAALQDLAKVAGITAKVAKVLAKLGIEAWWIKDATAPIQEYEDNMSVADEWAAKNEIPPQFQKDFEGHTVKEWYEWYRAKELSRMIGKLIPVFGGAVMVRGGFGMVGTIFKFVGLDKSAVLLSIVGSMGASALAKVLDNSDIVNNIAKLFTVSIHNQFIDLDVSQMIGAPAAQVLDATLGSLIGTAYERATGKKPTTDTINPNISAQKDPNAPANTPTAGSDKDATSQKDNKGAQTPADNKEVDTDFPDGAPGTPGSPWVSLGNGRWKNKNNGELVLY